VATRPDQRGRVCVDQATVAAASGPGTLLRRMLLWSLQVARGLSGQERGGPARRRAAHAFVALMEPAQRVDPNGRPIGRSRPRFGKHRIRLGCFLALASGRGDRAASPSRAAASAAEQLQELDNSSRRRCPRWCASPQLGIAWSIGSRCIGKRLDGHRAASLLEEAGGLGDAFLHELITATPP